MSQYASKDDMIGAMRQHIAELESRVQELGQMARDANSRRVIELEAELAAMRAGGEPVAEMVPFHTPSGKRVAVISRFQHLPIGTKLYTHPQPAAQDADPLQGAANWLAQAHGQFCVAVLQGCLMIGYNRAKRLHDAAIAARQGEKP